MINLIKLPLIGHEAGSPEWLADRQNHIGASEIAAAAGLSPYQTPLELYARKRGELPPIEDNDAMRMGRLLEPVVKAEFIRSSGLKLRNPNPPMYIHPDHNEIAATPDGIIDAATLLECKTASWRMKGYWGDEETDSVPDHYLCQCQAQMSVMGADLVHLAVLFDGATLKTFKVLRNDDLITLLISAALELWERIQNGDPPEPDFRHPSTPKLVRAMHQSINDVRVMLSEKAYAARMEYESLGKEIESLETRREQCQSIYEHEIGDNFAGVMPDGRMIRRSVIKGGPVSYVREDRVDYRAVKFDGGPIAELQPESEAT